MFALSSAAHGAIQDAGEEDVIEGVDKVSVILPGSVTQPLVDGTQPTDCRSGSYYIGDEGLEIASMEFQPFEMAQSTVRGCLLSSYGILDI
jgi:hypothetical protein